MPNLRIREIIDDLNELGGMTAAHHALITELVATCLLAAGPKPRDVRDACDVTVTSPLSGAERTKLWRERKKCFQGCDGVTSRVTTDAVDNNIYNPSIQEGGCGGKPIVTRASRGKRLPEDWNPSDSLWSWGKEKLSETNLRFETAAFKDYWAAQSGQRGVKLDWDKTWKTWIREAKRRGERFKPKLVTNTDAILNAPKRTWAEIKADKQRL